MTVREDMQAGDSGLAAWARAISAEHNDDHATIATGRLSPTELSTTIGEVGDQRARLSRFIPLPPVIQHAAGKRVWPEQSAEGHAHWASVGGGIDIDIRKGAPSAEWPHGVPLIIHDSTFTRTMINVRNSSGTALTNVADATERQFLSGQIKPASAGNAGGNGSFYGTPLAFSQAVALYGGTTPMVIEVKDDDLEFLADVLGYLAARNLHQSVVVFSAYWAHVQAIVAAGFRAGFVSDSATPSALAEAGVEYVAIAAAAVTASSVITPFHSAGVKVVVWNVLSLYDAARMWERGADHIQADSPDLALDRYPVQAARWDRGLGRPNIAWFRQSNSNVDTRIALRPELNGIEVADISSGRNKVVAAALSELGKGPISRRYRFKLQFLAGGAQDRWAMLFLGHGSVDNSAPFGNNVTQETTGITAGDNLRRGYTGRITRAGGLYLQFWNFGTGNSLKDNTAALPASPFAPSGEAGPVLDFELVVTTSAISLSCLTPEYTTTVTVTGADTANATAWRGDNASVSFLVNGADAVLSDWVPGSPS